jgi:hypothetical protein
MTILTSLLIATQGLLPSPTPLSIGTQGLLQTPGGPPPPPPVITPDQSGNFGRFGRYEKSPVIVRVNGVVARIVGSSVEIRISACITSPGTQACIGLQAPSQHIGATTDIIGCTQNLSASRIKPQISTAFELVGCVEENEAEIRALAQAALERFILDSETFS